MRMNVLNWYRRNFVIFENLNILLCEMKGRKLLAAHSHIWSPSHFLLMCRYAGKKSCLRLVYLSVWRIFYQGKNRASYAWVITAVKDIQIWRLLVFLFSFLFLCRLIITALIYSSPAPNIFGHYLTVNINILFVYHLYYSNHIFWYQSSLPLWKGWFRIRLYFRSCEQRRNQQLKRGPMRIPTITSICEALVIF